MSSLCLDPEEQAVAMMRRFGSMKTAKGHASLARSQHPEGSPAYNFWGRVLSQLSRPRKGHSLGAAA